MKVKPIEGRFVLSSQDGDWGLNEQDEWVCNNPQTVYFESSAGEGRAKYWTENIEEAFIFNDLESAISMRDATNRNHSPVSILQVAES